MSVAIRTATLEGKEEKLLSSITRRTRPDSLTIESGVAIIAVVGRGMAKAKGTAARIFTSLAKAGINIQFTAEAMNAMNGIAEAQDVGVSPEELMAQARERIEEREAAKAAAEADGQEA
jgi:aspartate kinase